jgi:hypothetical protein
VYWVLTGHSTGLIVGMCECRRRRDLKFFGRIKTATLSETQEIWRFLSDRPFRGGLVEMVAGPQPLSDDETEMLKLGETPPPPADA